MIRPSFLLIPLTILLVLAGCSVGPFGPSEQERPVQLFFNNSANTTQTFEVWVVELGSNVTVRMNDSRGGNATIGEGLSSRSSGEYGYYTVIEPPDSARFHGRFRVEPGEQKQSSIEMFWTNSAVVVILHQDNTIGWWASANCGGLPLIGLEVHTRPSQFGDAWAGYGCEY